MRHPEIVRHPGGNRRRDRRRRRRSLLGLCLSAALSLTLLTTALGHAQGTLPICVHVRGEARWAAAAFNHYVLVRNQCDRAAHCQVATDVNPEPQPLTALPGETAEVITYRGSPAQSFTPIVTCDLDR